MSGRKLWSAAIHTASDCIEIDPPQDLFVVVRFPGPNYLYDAAPDGQRFLAIQVPGLSNQESAPITVVSDWQAQD